MFTTHHEYFVPKHHKKRRVLFFHHTCNYIFGPRFRKALHATQEKIKLPVSGWLVVYSYTSRSEILHSYGDTSISDELRAVNLGICSAHIAFER